MSSRLGGVRRLHSGRYQARYRHPHGLLTPAGHPVMVKAPHTFFTEDDARAWLRHEQKLLEFGEWTHPEDREAKREARGITVAQAWEMLVAHKTGSGKWKASTEALNQSMWRLRLEPRLAHLPVAEVDRATVDAWWAWQLSTFPKTHKRNYESRTLLGSLMSHAVDLRLLDTNPVVGTVPKPKSEEPVIPTLAQVEYIVKHMPEHFRALTLLLAWCAHRIGEATALHPVTSVLRPRQDGDLWRLKVEWTLVYLDGQWVRTPPKSEDSKRIVPVPPHVNTALEWQLERYASPEWVFLNTRGGPVRPQTFRVALAARAEQAGCPGVTPHSLRHFAGTYYAGQGATTREIMHLLGHSTESMALHYQHVAKGRPDALARLVSESLEGDGE